VPSENATAPAPDRRTRKRAARRDALLELAADVVERGGIDALTMAALAEAADYATASLYTYFSSRSELLAAVQERALTRLAAVAREHVEAWDRQLAALDASEQVAALARLWAFADLFLTAPERFPREFGLQQQLLVTPGAEDTSDAATVVPAAMAVLDVPHRLLADAAAVGALAAGDPASDPVGTPLDPDLMRTFAWVVGMNGALLVDGLSTGLPSTGHALGVELTAALLRGWGAAPDLSGEAAELARRLPPPDDPAPPDDLEPSDEPERPAHPHRKDQP
jgi:AcrR family transcriptional regulator